MKVEVTYWPGAMASVRPYESMTEMGLLAFRMAYLRWCEESWEFEFVKSQGEGIQVSTWIFDYVNGQFQMAEDTRQ